MMKVFFRAIVFVSESGRLACFPWPKEQFVALDEVLGWAVDRPEMVGAVCRLIQELHGKVVDRRPTGCLLGSNGNALRPKQQYSCKLCQLIHHLI